MTTNPKIEAVIQRLEAEPERLQAAWSLPPQEARFLGLLAAVSGAKRILEVGTSIGYSGLYLGRAVQERGGHLDTIDASKERQAQAKAHFQEAGLAETITCHLGDALSVLDQLIAAGQTFDLMFIDARKSEYIDYFCRADRLLVPGGLLVADNTRSHREEMQAFLDAVTAWERADLPTPNGVLLARKPTAAV